MPWETSICPPYIAFETTYFNTFLYNFAASKRRDELPTTIKSRRRKSLKINLCRQFYRCGALVGLLTSISSTGLLLYIIFNSIKSATSTTSISNKESPQQSSTSILTPLVPGVNVPYIHIIYIFFGYTVSTIVHECGHALAMATVGAHIDSVGWFIMAGLPGAYVGCDSNTVQVLKPHRALRVYFAGVWHNVLLVLVTIATVYVWRWTPIIPSLFYQSSDGVNIVSIQPNSLGANLWIRAGVDVGSRIVAINDLPTMSLEQYENVLVDILTRKQNKNKNKNITTTYKERIDVRFSTSTRTMPWRQGPESLYHDIQVVDMRPGVLLSGACNMTSPIFCYHLPQYILLIVSYIASISAGLAFINSLPVLWLDGDDALGAWLQLLLPSSSFNKLKQIKNVVLMFGTAVLFVVLFISFQSAFY